MNKIIQLLITTFACFSLLFGVIQTNAQAFLTNGLVAYYPFTGNANDSSGNGNNGVVQGAMLTAGRLGIPNTAYYFSGNGSTYISIPDSPSLEITSNITLSAWIETGGGGYAQPRIVSKGPYQLGLWDTSANPQFFFALQPISPGVVLSPQIAVNTNTWISVIGTYDGQSMMIYINGSLAGQLTTSGTMGTNNEPVGIGENLDDHSDYVLGSIDNVRIYNRALSSNEVAQLFAYETPPLIGLVQAVKPTFSYLSIGTNYQMQVSTDLINWTNQGAVFMATNSNIIYPQYFDVSDWNQLFFRVQVAP